MPKSFNGSINGVAGVFSEQLTAGENTFIKQEWTSNPKFYTENGIQFRMIVKIRFDDTCKNGHNTFAITADIDEKSKNGVWRVAAAGCLHEDISKRFPKLSHLIKWHLMNSDGPTHYVANTIYHASDKDHWGKRKGEPRHYATFVQFGKNPIKHKLDDKFAKFLIESNGNYDFNIIDMSEQKKGTISGKIEYYPGFTYGGHDINSWHQCPFKSEEKAFNFLIALRTCEPEFIKIPISWGEGKERNFDAARNCAIWHEATDEQLSADEETLKNALLERLPNLIAEFKKDIEKIGFKWKP